MGILRRVPSALIAVVGAIGGVTIAYLDSRPSWDDTGITVIALIGLAFGCSFVSGRRPWLYVLLVGAPTPLIEIAQGGGPAPLLALLFAGIGAFAGWTVRRMTL